jgi:hypothetical protein
MYGHGWQAQKPVMGMGVNMKKSIINTKLPDDLKQVLNERIISDKHSYQELSEWLSEQGYRIGKSTIQRYGIELKKNLNPLVGVSPLITFKHHKDIEFLGLLFTQKMFIDAEIDRLKRVIFDAQDSQGG